MERLRQYSIQQQHFLEQLLTDSEIPFLGQTGERGAFIAMPHQQADLIAEKLEVEGIICDAREGLLRFGPDLLNTKAELVLAVEKLDKVWKTLLIKRVFFLPQAKILVASLFLETVFYQKIWGSY